MYMPLIWFFVHAHVGTYILAFPGWTDVSVPQIQAAVSAFGIWKHPAHSCLILFAEANCSGQQPCVAGNVFDSANDPCCCCRGCMVWTQDFKVGCIPADDLLGSTQRLAPTALPQALFGLLTTLRALQYLQSTSIGCVCACHCLGTAALCRRRLWHLATAQVPSRRCVKHHVAY